MKECEACGSFLTGRRRKWCSDTCKKQQARRTWVYKVYGLSLEEYEQILFHQDGVCAICGRAPAYQTHLHIDHEHGGHVRGLLCGYCNRNLVGRLKNHEMAQRLADYLKDPPAIKALGKVVMAPGRPKKKRQPRKRTRGKS